MKKRYIIEQLEPRLLLSSAPLLVPLDVPHPPLLQDAPTLFVETVPGYSRMESLNQGAQDHLRHEILFVDAGVEDYQELVDDMRTGADDQRLIDVVVLDKTRDGITQITETLSHYQGLDAVHIVSHGSDGELLIGSSSLTMGNLDNYADSIEGWRKSLNSDADLMFYGCDLASGDNGRALINNLSLLTGADVAASIDPTGNALLGGDWDLEFHAGPIETTGAFSARIQQNWSDLLAEATLQDNFNAVSYSGNNGTVNWAGNWQETGDPGGPASVNGNIRIVNNALQITTAAKTETQRGISRAADLSGATSAYLSFTYDTQKLTGNGQVQLQIRADGSSTWDTLGIYKITANTAGNNVLLDVSSYISSNTEIRFVSEGKDVVSSLGLSDGIDNFIVDNVKIQYTTTNWTSALWISTDGDVNAGGQPGVDTWKKGDILQFADPNLSFEPGTTSGTFSVIGNWSSFANFSDGHNINALHYVSRDITIGSSNFQLYAGDLLFASKDATAGAFGGLNVDKDDIVLFRPTTPGNYSSGTFSILLKDLVPGQELRGISLIERDTVVGNVTLHAGDFLFLRQGGTEEKQVWLYETGDVEPGTGTSGTATVLLNGADNGIGISKRLVDVDLVETTTTIGGRTLNAGTILLAVDGGDTIAGTTAVTEWDIFALAVTTVSDPILPNKGNATASLFFQGQDLSLSGGSSKIDAFTLTVTSNSAPVLTPVSPSLTTITEDNTGNTGNLVSDILGGSATDADGDTIGIAITGSSNGNGTWQYSTNGGSTWSPLGAVSDNSALLLRNTDRVRFVPDGMNADSASITYRAWDRSDNRTAGTKVNVSTNGGSTAFSTSSDTASIAITSVNDAPSGTNKTVILMEDASYTFSASDFGFTDPIDSPANTLLAVKITTVPVSGTLKNNGVTVNAGDTISMADINLNRLVFTPAANANGAGYASFTFQVQDDGGTANSGVDLDPTPNTMTINVTAVNDAPALTAPSGPITYTTLDPATILDNLATATDIDSTDLNGGSLTVSFASGGTLLDVLSILPGGNVTLNFLNVEVSGTTVGSYSGGTFGTPLIITWNANSTPANIQEVLRRIAYSNVSVIPDTSTRIINFVLTDGDGGTSNIAQQQVNFSGANQAPAVTLPGATADYTENSSPVLIDSTATITDVDSLNMDTGTLTVGFSAGGTADDELSILPGGNVTLNGFNVEVNGIAVGTYSGGSAGTNLVITWNTNSTPADIQEVLRRIAFSNSAENPNANLRTIDVMLTDGDGGTSTTVQQQVNVLAVNDAPGGTDKAITTSEDTAYTFSAADFGFSDPAEGDALLAVKITTVPVSGTLKNNGVTVNAGDTISIADINLNRLVFTPAANANGAGYASFTYQVQDDGGIANGGVDRDPTPNTMTINVTAVNDAPTVSGSVAGQTVNDNATILPFTGVTISDADNPTQILSVSITLDVAAKGAFTTLNGFTYAGGGVYTFNGTAAEATAAIRGVGFDPADNRVAPGSTETTTFTISVDDGIAPAVTDNTTTVILISMNDAPVGGFTVASVIPQAEISQATDGSGVITINWKGIDAESYNVFLNTFEYSDDGGITWYSPVNGDLSGAFSTDWTDNGGGGWSTATGFGAATTHSFTFNTQHADVTAAHSLDNVDQNDIKIRFVLNDGTDNSTAPVVSQNFRVDNEAPTDTFTSAVYYYASNSLVMRGTDFATIAPAGTNVAAYMDWAKFVIDINSDNGTTPDIIFNGSDVISCTINNNSTLTIVFTSAKAVEIESQLASHEKPDSLDITVGFSRDSFGNAATTDGTVASPPLVSNLNAGETYTEDTALDLTDIVITKPGSVITAALKLSDPNAGSLSTATSGSVTSTYNATTGEWRARGNVDDINELLAGVTFTPALNYNSNFKIYTAVSDGITTPQTGEKIMTGTPVNDTPAAIILDNATVAENAVAAVIGNITVTDPDAGDTHTFTVSDARFEVVAGQLKLIAGESLDFETEPTVSITVTATDAGGLSTSQSFTITVSNINEAPAITLDNATVAENAVAAVIGNITVTDPDAGDTHTFTVSDARFEVVAGQLKLIAGESLDFETEPTVSITVTATDAGGLSTSQSFTITVSNINEAPAITLDNATVAENAVAAVIGNITVTDPDAGDTHTFTVSDARFEVVAGQLKLIAGESLDFETEPTVSITVTATDAGGLSTSQSFTITVSNINEAPAITLDNATVAENAVAAVIGNITVTDPDAGDTHTFTVSDARFEVVAGQLKLIAGESLDFETEPTVSITVTATDAGGLSTSQSFTITVSNINEAPAITLDNATVAENAVAAVIGNITVTDPDAGDTHTFTVSDARFEVVAGQLKLIAGESLDFETEPTVSITVTATDAGGLNTSQSFTITVSNINDMPVLANPAADMTVDEDAAVAVIDLSAVFDDADIASMGDSLSLSVVSSSPGLVSASLSGTTLTLTYGADQNGIALITLTAADTGGLFVDTTFTVTVAPVGDTPQVASVSTLPNTLSGPILLNRNANDGAEVTHFRISGITNGTLYLADGVTQIHNGDYITYAQAQAGLRFMPALNSTTQGSFAVEASENGSSVAAQSGAATVVVTINIPVKETPIDDHEGDPTDTDPDIPEIVVTVPVDNSGADIPDRSNAPRQTPRMNAGNISQTTEHRASQDNALHATRETGDHPAAARYRVNLDTMNSFIDKALKTLLPDELQGINFEQAVAKAYEHLRGSLDSLKKETNQDMMFNKTIVGSAIMLSASLSAGYVIWLIRGGMLLSSVLSSLPAWQFVDPLPVLARRRDDSDKEDDESLESIAKSGSSDDDENDVKQEGPKKDNVD